MTLRQVLHALTATAMAVGTWTGAASGQTDSATVRAGEQYGAGGLKRTLLGGGYRDLWTTPIRVPVLDLGRFAGGLTPVELGSGMQTISLRLRGADGREYNFRSVDKDQSGGLHPDLRDTFIDRLAQDQVSAKHPGGALIASTILDAAGVLHPVPQLYLMPDSPELGEFRGIFGGMLGLLEIHPNEGEGDSPGFAGSDRIVDSQTLLEHLEETAEHRADSRGYLRVRLIDLLVGDWDRHPGQWRWARFPREHGGFRWVPVPEDRDNAFSSHDGLLIRVAGAAAPHLNEYGARYASVSSMVQNAELLDRWILSDLPREEFDQAAEELRSRITDRVLEKAVSRTPPEYQRLRGAELLRELRARRDSLPRIAREYYALLAREVDVHATDGEDRAEVLRRADGSLEVRLLAQASVPGDPYFNRLFLPGETREVRIYLHGGDDVGLTGGSGSPIQVRLIGGGGDDLLADSAAPGAGLTALHDSDGQNRLLPSRETVVDQRPFVAPERKIGAFNENAPAFQDWGMRWQWFQPYADWRYNVGPVIGGGPSYTRYGFRRVPHARRVDLRALYAPLHGRFGLELFSEIQRTNSPDRITYAAHASQLAVTRFHGFGNETAGEGSSDRFKVWSTEYSLSAAYHRALNDRAELFAGPVVRYTRPELEEGGPADQLRPFGSESFGEVGALAGAIFDARDLPSYPRTGVYAAVTASAFPGVWDEPGAFGRLDGEATTYLPLPLPLESTLAIRAGSSLAWGDYPLQQAAFLGGRGTVRGAPRQRFAGDAAVWGGAELRSFLTRFNFISRGDLGLILLADAGRVFVEGESSDRIHTGFGGGLWVGILDRTRTASITFASGTEEAAYFTFGMPF
ncbi:MAG TPA: BamA/TamA family outer membrane protein [Longimicrobiaceae bacterium]